MSGPTNQELFELLRAWVAANYPGDALDETRLRLHSGRKVTLPVPLPAPRPPKHSPREVFVPTPFQQEILDALDGRALRTEPLAEAVGCDRRNLYRRPGGIAEVIDHGLVARHARLGYFRPDAPPPEILDEQRD